MTQYRPYSKKKKIDYIKEQTIAVDTHIENLQKIPDYQALPAKDFYKNAKLIYESDWIATEHEKLPEATAIETGILLPERAKYGFSVSLAITEQFLPYLTVEVLARTNQDVIVEGVYSYRRGAYKPVQMHLYNWEGITYTTGCQAFGDPRLSPEPADLYVEGDTGFFFAYPSYHFPIPVGEAVEFELPGKQYLGFDNAVLACPQSSPPPGQYWEDAGIVEFQTLVTELGYQDAVDLIEEYWNDIVFTEQSYPAKAFEIIDEERIATGHQVKKFIKKNDNSFDLIVEGSFLQISESIEETSYSHEEFPTYQPAGDDMEVKLNVYSINPNVYSERKYYT